MKWIFLPALLCATAVTLAAAEPVPTEVTVRVIARDAKAIYEAVGGAWVTITDLRTGEVLAAGAHNGKSSGSTQKIMIEPRKRGEIVFDTPGAASFTATIPLREPAVVEIAAEGPVGHPQARRSASKTLLLLPGEHLTGDGVVLEIHGLIVTVDPPKGDGATVAVEAGVMMACGCPIEPDGLWNANEFKVTARLLDAGGEALISGPLQWEGGRWRATFPRPQAAPAAVEVVAGHTPTANFGLHRLELK
ncbi:MAG TPA: hypothetical protein VNA04_02375 [Thermoanaerobaculia bacterium]|nr:hypothetical protein [Thermoanaerobaculia bacterium]